MTETTDTEYSIKLELDVNKIVSDGKNEVLIKCSITGKNKKAIKEDVPVRLKIDKHKVDEERTTHKGAATFKFKPTRATAKTKIVCETPYGAQTAWIMVNPTPKQYFRDLAQSIVLAFIVAFCIIRPFILQTYFIPSGSMEPTMYEHDRLIALMFPFKFREPKQGEIIIFKRYDEMLEHAIPLGFKTIRWKSPQSYIKRVIAKGGDTIEVKYHTVYVNNIPLTEPYIAEPPSGDFPPFKVPADSFFMMGDNRNNSRDSRYWGALPRKQIVSKPVFRFWPPDRIGVIHAADMTPTTAGGK